MNDSDISSRRARSSTAERLEWVRKYKASGVSTREFAGQQGLKLSTLQRWISLQPGGRKVRRREPLFAEVKLPVAPGASPWAAELIRPDGVTLRVAKDLYPALLQQLLRAC